jgi:hypothetical protein
MEVVKRIFDNLILSNEAKRWTLDLIGAQLGQPDRAGEKGRRSPASSSLLFRLRFWHGFVCLPQFRKSRRRNVVGIACNIHELIVE